MIQYRLGMTKVSFDNRTNNYQHSIRGTTAIHRYMFMYKGFHFMLLWELIKQSKAVIFVSDTGVGSPQNRQLRENGCKVGEGRNEEITSTNPCQFLLPLTLIVLQNPRLFITHTDTKGSEKLKADPEKGWEVAGPATAGEPTSQQHA